MDECARDWNRLYPPGTKVRVRFSDGRQLDGVTAGYAQQWGSLAVIRLKDNVDVYTISALERITLNDRLCGSKSDSRDDAHQQLATS